MASNSNNCFTKYSVIFFTASLNWLRNVISSLHFRIPLGPCGSNNFCEKAPVWIDQWNNVLFMIYYYQNVVKKNWRQTLQLFWDQFYVRHWSNHSLIYNRSDWVFFLLDFIIYLLMQEEIEARTKLSDPHPTQHNFTYIKQAFVAFYILKMKSWLFFALKYKVWLEG